MKAHTITVPRTAHYYSHGTPGEHVRYFWIATHGYGQMAKNFIHKFDGLDTSEHFVIAPDALSRFYWEGFTGQVASSWMTKEDRLDEIADYAQYLTMVYERYVPQLPKDVKIILFGFSQGVATQYRWMMERFLRFDALVMWAGFLPEDLDYRPHLEYFNSKKIIFLYGDQDRFLTPKRLAWHQNMVREKGLELEEIPFEGKHVVDRQLLAELVEKIKTV